MIFSEMQIIDSRQYKRVRRMRRIGYNVSADGKFWIPFEILNALEITRGDYVLVSLDVKKRYLFMMKSDKEDTRAFKVIGGSSYLISGVKRILQKLGIAYESGKVKCRSEIVGDDEGAAIARVAFIEERDRSNGGSAMPLCN